MVEFARNVLGMRGAASTEIDPETTEPVVIDMPEHNPGQGGGGDDAMQFCRPSGVVWFPPFYPSSRAVAGSQ